VVRVKSRSCQRRGKEKDGDSALHTGILSSDRSGLVYDPVGLSAAIKHKSSVSLNTRTCSYDPGDAGISGRTVYKNLVRLSKAEIP
jgi:hypothetical protein